ncbi:MAG TPA: hypothetical protein ENJ79_11325 [Gammaproteobacteria bacterium]|nr:hypothetical protein [Gammaproteobacteria bacterium]
MGEIVTFRRPKAARKHRGNTLCRRGFHKWEVVDRPFDVKQGRLVTRYRCTRCGREKTGAC